MEPDFEALREAIGKLRKESLPEWGTMNATRMLTHCNAFIEVSTGAKKVNRMTRWKGWLIGGIYLQYLRAIKYDIRKLQKNSKTLKIFLNQSKNDNFEIQMGQLLKNLEEIELLNSAKAHHQLYGNIERKRFQKLIHFHTAYHLYQFGLI